MPSRPTRSPDTRGRTSAARRSSSSDSSTSCYASGRRIILLEILRNEPDVWAFPAGETIFREGEAGDCMYAVLEGEIEIRKQGVLLDTVTAGSVFGEMALIDQSPRSATAMARTDCRVVAVGQRRFTFLVQQTPYFALQIMHILADRLRKNASS